MNTEEPLFDVIILDYGMGMVSSIAAYGVHSVSRGQRPGAQEVEQSLRDRLVPGLVAVTVPAGIVSSGDMIPLPEVAQ